MTINLNINYGEEIEIYNNFQGVAKHIQFSCYNWHQFMFKLIFDNVDVQFDVYVKFLSKNWHTWPVKEDVIDHF